MTAKNRPHRTPPPARAVPILSDDGIDNEAGSDEAPADGETLLEAERDIGINEWIDPETGEPAEGQSPPHLEQE
ncbi:MAG: hypothetical protein ABIU58_10510 [Ramlibacter sp.]